MSRDLVDTLDPSEIVRALAEGGVAGAHALVRERATQDVELRRRLEATRERVRRQAERDLRRISERYDRTLEELGQAETQSRAALAAELGALEEQLRLARGRAHDAFRLPQLSPAVSRALLLPQASWNQPAPRPSAWQRFLRWLTNLFARWFGRRTSTPGGPGPKERRIPIATLSLDGRTLGPSALGEALARLTPAEEEELRERVDQTIRASENDLRRQAEAKRRDAEAQRRRLEEERQAALARDRSEIERRARDAEDRRIDRELQERGWVAPATAAGLEVTYALVERFARLLLEGEERTLSAEVRFALRGGAATGVYEKARLRQPDEVARLDVPSSLLAARLVGQRHLDESTSFIYREATSESVHVVLAVDRSGSMAERGKLDAAKKALLALYVAVHRKHPTAIVDVLAFDNAVEVMDLRDLWECSPGAFTNTAEALRTAHRLLTSSPASRRELFLITDGLPEAYTDDEGHVRAGQLEVAMDRALARARELARVHPLRFSMVLLRSDHPEYEVAARAIARTIGGELVLTDPAHLGVELLVRWAHGGEAIERRPTTPSSAPTPLAAPPAGSGGGRRRRADRRMGG